MPSSKSDNEAGKRGRGRPTDAYKGAVLKLRLTDDQLALVHAAAEKSGTTASEWVREVVVKRAERELAEKK